MSGVLTKGSSAAVFLYALVGIFGYVTFVNTPEVITTNILEAPFQGNVAITIVRRFILIIITFRETSHSFSLY